MGVLCTQQIKWHSSEFNTLQKYTKIVKTVTIGRSAIKLALQICFHHTVFCSAIFQSNIVSEEWSREP